MNQHKSLAIQALSQLKGDDLCRARMAFQDMTEAELDQQYGSSGKTRRQILAEYAAHDGRVDAAVNWVKAKPD